MNEKKSIIVIDIGTTNCKISLFLYPSITKYREVKFETVKVMSNDGYVDFDFKYLWNKILSAIVLLNKESPYQVDSISIASFGESGVIVSDAGEVLTSMPAWYDSRGGEYLSLISDSDKELLYNICGLPLHSNYSALKIRWLIENNDLNGKDNIFWLHTPEFIAWKLTGVFQSEITLASRTLCLNIKDRNWSETACKILNIPKNIFPPLINYYTSDISKVDDEMSQKIGFSHPVRVIVAGHDHMVGARGLRLEVDEILNSTGTTDGILVLKDIPDNSSMNMDNSLSIGCYSYPDIFTVFSSLSTGGYALEWVSNSFNYSLEDINKSLCHLYENYINNDWEPEDIGIFIPHLRGASSPNKSRKAKGLLYGLNDSLDLVDILRDVSIGLAMEFMQAFNCFKLESRKAMKVIGPAVNNPLWLQLKSDLLNIPVIAVHLDEVVSFGALSIACPNAEIPDSILFKNFYPNEIRREKLLSVFQRWKEFYNLKLSQEGII